VTNRDRFLESLMNREHTVLGLTLRPFCLWHMLQLARVGSPFLFSHRKASIESLCLAAGICASGPETPIADLTPAWPKGIEFDLALELEKFQCYRRDYAAPPRRYDAAGEPLKCPWELAVAARLMRYGHMSWHEAITLPFGLALWIAAALGEANGGDPGIISEAEERNLIACGWMTPEGEIDAG
jgi:hypothetical protein